MQLQLPPFAAADGTQVDGLGVRCASCLDLQTAVCLELSEAALRYVRLAMLAAAAAAPKRIFSSDGVRWRADRKRFLAWVEKEGGRKVYKTFKPEAPDDDDAMAEAKDKARRWVEEGGEGEEGEESEEGDTPQAA